jgi:hypothetical protein
VRDDEHDGVVPLSGHQQTHRDLTGLGMTVGRLDERLVAIHNALDRHMREEHKDFQEALKKVESLHDTVRDLHSAAKVTRWIAATISGMVGVLWWIRDHIRFLP